MSYNNRQNAERPSLGLALTEVPRAGLEFGLMAAFLPLLSMVPRGDGQSVLVLPGFLSDDAPTAPLRRFLSRLGYRAHGWELGHNLGPKTIGRTAVKLLARLDALYDTDGEKVSVIGWSLGGVMARQIARTRPAKVRQVITLGSPITGGPYDNHVWPLLTPLTGQKLDGEATKAQFRESHISPPVPCSAIYSEEDGVVSGPHCREVAGQCNESIRIYGSHLGLAVNPMAYVAIADRLAQQQGQWAAFADGESWSRMLYPKPTSH